VEPTKDEKDWLGRKTTARSRGFRGGGEKKKKTIWERRRAGHITEKVCVKRKNWEGWETGGKRPPDVQDKKEGKNPWGARMLCLVGRGKGKLCTKLKTLQSDQKKIRMGRPPR